ncbi:Ger(x)C family spore germination protein [Ferroacidibacillus organovorans]|uniref:Uncharacterized protein n=1 Tax=Ferroacidibacillus organovorans TaxID=1765683 RepID=A0A853KC18_9BACL|nr:Ger(x)C family spore germination C-terminal domain-containing protein [Ferroacidibacillus organovorans]KYP81050.1 hypothetical protein AYJ22_08955 [Ferroacidibacillus organovorans]OAG93679.1 hypothetical protein AYW79_09220 [Ferroacidibacillus organovorans]
MRASLNRKSHRVTRRSLALSLLFASSFALTGCWDSHELEDLTFISIVGVDEAPQKNNLQISFQYEAPLSIQGSNPNVAQAKNIVATFVTPSFGAARNLANITTDRQLSLLQCKAIILSEALIKHEDAIELMEALVRERDFRRDIAVITSLDPIEKIMHVNRSKLGSSSARTLENLRNQVTYTSLVPKTTLNDFFIRVESGNTLPITPLIAIKSRLSKTSQLKNEDEVYAGQVPLDHGDNPVEAMGAEVYQNNLGVGRLTGAEVRIYAIMRNKTGQFIKSFDDPVKHGARDAVLIKQYYSPHVTAHLDKTQLHILIDVPLQASLIGTNAGVDFVQNARYTRLLERGLERHLEQETYALLRRCQTAFHGDIFGFSGALKTRFLTDQGWKAFHYVQKFNHAKFTVRYHILMSSFGKQRAPANITE